jgi:hypothetical protein
MEDKDNHLSRDDIAFMSILRHSPRLPVKDANQVTTPKEFQFYSEDVRNYELKFDKALKERRKEKSCLGKFSGKADERFFNANVTKT